MTKTSRQIDVRIQLKRLAVLAEETRNVYAILRLEWPGIVETLIERSCWPAHKYADKLGISPTYLSMIRNGVEPSPGVAAKIGKELLRGK